MICTIIHFSIEITNDIPRTSLSLRQQHQIILDSLSLDILNIIKT